MFEKTKTRQKQILVTQILNLDALEGLIKKPENLFELRPSCAVEISKNSSSKWHSSQLHQKFWHFAKTAATRFGKRFCQRAAKHQPERRKINKSRTEFFALHDRIINLSIDGESATFDELDWWIWRALNSFWQAIEASNEVVIRYFVGSLATSIELLEIKCDVVKSFKPTSTAASRKRNTDPRPVWRNLPLNLRFPFAVNKSLIYEDQNLQSRLLIIDVDKASIDILNRTFITRWIANAERVRLIKSQRQLLTPTSTPKSFINDIIHSHLIIAVISSNSSITVIHLTHNGHAESRDVESEGSPIDYEQILPLNASR